jgi:hypothetical protein
VSDAHSCAALLVRFDWRKGSYQNVRISQETKEQRLKDRVAASETLPQITCSCNVQAFHRGNTKSTRTGSTFGSRS